MIITVIADLKNFVSIAYKYDQVNNMSHAVFWGKKQ